MFQKFGSGVIEFLTFCYATYPLHCTEG